MTCFLINCSFCLFSYLRFYADSYFSIFSAFYLLALLAEHPEEQRRTGGAKGSSATEQAEQQALSCIQQSLCRFLAD